MGNGWVSEAGFITLGGGMSIRRMGEEHRRFRSLDRDAVGRLLVLAHAAEQYITAVHNGQTASMIPLEWACDVANGLREATASTKPIDFSRLSEAAFRAMPVKGEVQ